jgi:hypothetical protein
MPHSSIPSNSSIHSADGVTAILFDQEENDDADLFQEAFDASFELEIYSLFLPPSTTVKATSVSWDVDHVLSSDQSPAPPVPTTTTTQEPELHISSAVCVSPAGSVTTLETSNIASRETMVTPAKRSLSDEALLAEDDEAFAERYALSSVKTPQKVYKEFMLGSQIRHLICALTFLLLSPP